MGEDVCFNTFGLHQTKYVRQTTSRDDTVVYIMSNTINENARCGRPLQIHHTMQHVAALKCFQSESTLLCKHSPHERYKRRQRTVFLIRVSISVEGTGKLIQIQNGYNQCRITSSKRTYLLAMWKRFCPALSFAASCSHTAWRRLEMH